MSYAVYDEKGYVGDLCSNNGLNELKTAAKDTVLAPLFENGSMELDEQVKKDIALIDVPVLDNLKELISKSETVAIITDGTF